MTKRTAQLTTFEQQQQKNQSTSLQLMEQTRDAPFYLQKNENEGLSSLG